MNAQRILASGAAALLVLIVLAIVDARRRRLAGRHDDDAADGPPGTLRAHVAAGNITLDGPVRDANEKSSIEEAAGERFGNDNVVSNLEVVATADSAAWLAEVMAKLPRKGSGFGPVDIAVTKTVLTVSGRVPTAAAGSALLEAVEDGVRPRRHGSARDRRRGRRRRAAEAHRRRRQRPHDRVRDGQRGNHEGGADRAQVARRAAQGRRAPRASSSAATPTTSATRRRICGSAGRARTRSRYSS